MRLSRSFIPTLKETPAEAQIASHRLMLRAGLVRQTSAGIYAWLPLGFRVLKNIERIVREEQDAAGAQEVLMPTIQPAELWKESGRYEDYGKEMLRIRDRHDRDMLYGPTNEEMITDLFRQSVKSYREVPQILYHIQWKFRDEVRPRFGVMRGREFLMKDAYSFDLDYAGAVVSYRKMMLAYMRTFQRMGLKAIPMEAESGPIGGDLSHEFIILAPTGESQVYFDAAFEEIDYCQGRRLQPRRRRRSAPLLRADDHALCGDRREARCRRRGRRWRRSAGARAAASRSATSSISAPSIRTRWAARSPAPTASRCIPEMGSYGIGVSRLVGAVIEASHDDAGIIWPDSIAPFRAAILNLKMRRRGLRPAVRGRCTRKLGRAGAVRRPRGAGRREVRRRRPDGPSVADHRRSPRCGGGQGGAEAPRHRRAGGAVTRGRAGADRRG